MSGSRPLALAGWVLTLAVLTGCLSGCGTLRSQRASPPAVAFSTAPPRPMARSVPSSCRAQGALYTERRMTRRRVVALTFDDGPSPYTRRILDVLEAEHARATFFVVGQQVSDEADQVRRALRDGDLLANHTYTHADMLKLSLPDALRELAGTQQALWQVTGFTPCVWRAPYGSIDDRLEYLARALGMLSVQWDTDPQDFTAPPADTIYHRVLYGNPRDPDPGAHPGSIVLMHDGGGDRSHTVAALPRIIHALRAQGYRFVTVAQLLGLALVYQRR